MCKDFYGGLGGEMRGGLWGDVNRIKRPNTWLHRPMLQT